MKNLIAFIVRHKIHFFSWAIFMACETVIIGLATGIFGDPMAYLVHYFQNILLFYFCALWLYPKIFISRLSWIWRLPVFIGIVYIIYLTCSYVVDNFLLKETSWYGMHEISISKRYIFTQLWRALFFMGSSGFYFLFRRHQAEIETRKRMQQEHYQSLLSERDMALQLANAKNSYLKAQINPHLLFNTLSFIYQDIYLSSPKTAEAVMELSEIMRYSVNCEIRETFLELAEEIEQVKRLINLHAMRFEGEIFVDFRYQPNIGKQRFLPLVLLTLAENIFKHGVFQDPEYPAELSIDIRENYFVIQSKNWPSRKNTIKNMNKGLENIKQRLEITYGKSASFEHGLSQDYYIVKITAHVLSST
ncbi:sensor histidine kinase [Pedobacter sp. MW01-1-1]|uniref:sensor histidine kinase n=1 Tax=Pedobacter sp. MW01-1-1 TaxID=3383027 RepID=UPI003FEDB645